MEQRVDFHLDGDVVVPKIGGRVSFKGAWVDAANGEEP